MRKFLFLIVLCSISQLHAQDKKCFGKWRESLKFYYRDSNKKISDKKEVVYDTTDAGKKLVKSDVAAYKNGTKKLDKHYLIAHESLHYTFYKKGKFYMLSHLSPIYKTKVENKFNYNASKKVFTLTDHYRSLELRYDPKKDIIYMKKLNKKDKHLDWAVLLRVGK